jgi:hypothetical protein
MRQARNGAMVTRLNSAKAPGGTHHASAPRIGMHDRRTARRAGEAAVFGLFALRENAP